ncbi:hypothetical protein SBADM41S_06347 [Streptomyces badius]
MADVEFRCSDRTRRRDGAAPLRRFLETLRSAGGRRD